MFTPDTILASPDTPLSIQQPSLSPLWDKIVQISEADLPVYGYRGQQASSKTFSALRHHQGRLIFVDSGRIQITFGSQVFDLRENRRSGSHHSSDTKCTLTLTRQAIQYLFIHS